MPLWLASQARCLAGASNISLLRLRVFWQPLNPRTVAISTGSPGAEACSRRAAQGSMAVPRTGFGGPVVVRASECRGPPGRQRAATLRSSKG